MLSSINIKSPILLAPLAGYTDSPFRRLAMSHGAGMSFTELVSAEGIVRNSHKTFKLMEFTDEERPLSIQIFGNNPDTMAEAAHIAEKLNPDGIDINMGCCAPKICGGEAGASLIRNPEKVYAVASKVKSAISLPLSVKIRIGWDDSTRNYLEVSKAIEEAGASFMTVHGRTRAQKYMGLADWDAISEVAANIKIPVVGNGDILSYDDAMMRLKDSGCAAVMIGRGAIGNPWIFSGRTPEKEEVVETIKKHVEMMTDFYDEYGIILMRKHIVKYIHGFRNAATLRTKLILSESKEDIYRILEEI